MGPCLFWTTTRSVADALSRLAHQYCFLYQKAPNSIAPYPELNRHRRICHLCVPTARADVVRPVKINSMLSSSQILMIVSHIGPRDLCDLARVSQTLHAFGEQPNQLRDPGPAALVLHAPWSLTHLGHAL